LTDETEDIAFRLISVGDRYSHHPGAEFSTFWGIEATISWTGSSLRTIIAL
jgi:hypothetical protein